MYDLVLFKEVPPPKNSISAGVLSSKRGDKAIVHRSFTEEDWVSNNNKGKFVSKAIEDNNRLRYEQIAIDLEKSSEISTFSLYEDLSNLKLNFFEEKLRDCISHLETITAYPVLDLKREEIKMPVGRVKRFTTRSLFHLAGHSEDWQNRTFISVVPKALFSQVQEDLWCTYENKLMVSLCKDIDQYLTKRLNSLSQVETSFKDLQQFYERREYYFAKTAERYERRIKKYFLDKGNEEIEAMDLLESTKVILEHLQKRLRGLWSSTLFKKVGRQRIDINNIHLTNLLQNHQHYRYLITLRAEFLKFKGDKTKVKNGDEFEKEQLKLMRHILIYVDACIQCVLDEEGYKREETGVFVKNGFKISIENDGIAITVSDKNAERCPVRFIPLPSTPFQSYKNQKSSFDGDTIIVYPTVSGTFDLTDSGNFEAYQYLPQKGSITTIGISPLSIFTQEIIAMVLFRWLLVPDLKSYPKKCEKVPALLVEYLKENAKFLVHIQDKTVSILKDHDCLKADNLREKFEEYLNSKRKKEQFSITTYETFSSASKLAYEISVCRVCGIKSQFNPENNGSFNIKCRGCQTEWGKDGTTGRLFFRASLTSQKESYPFISFGRYESL